MNKRATVVWATKYEFEELASRRFLHAPNPCRHSTVKSLLVYDLSETWGIGA